MNLEEIKKALPADCRIQQVIFDEIVVECPAGREDEVAAVLFQKMSEAPKESTP